jgi:nucleoside-diphosphate-sugar epimerase
VIPAGAADAQGGGDLHVIAGTGPLGLAVMRELVRRGARVRLVNRSGRAAVPAGVEVVAADVTDLAAARRACAAASVVYNCINAPYTDWPARLPALWHGVLEGAVAAGARLVCGDNLYMYGPAGAAAGALRETLPSAATGRKGVTRARIATAVLDAHRAGRVRATIGRASDFYGPHVRTAALGERVFAAALAGKPVQVLGNPDTLHTYTYINDFARALVTLGAEERALGEVWHVPSAPTVTTRELVTMVGEVLGRKLALRAAPAWLVGALGLVSPIMRELKETVYQFASPFVVDHTKFERAFGAEVTPHQAAISKTLQWFREGT